MTFIDRKIIFSPCRRYRYTLWREWGELPLGFHIDPHTQYLPGRLDQYVQFIGLNPSTADETQDDPTVRRCINFAKLWGFGAMCMTNAFAWRDTDPQKMKTARFPVTEPILGHCTNDFWLNQIAQNAGLVIAAWGKNGKHLGRDEQIVRFIPKLYCLGVNSDGTPKHPLYLPAYTQPIPYKPEYEITNQRGAAAIHA